MSTVSKDNEETEIAIHPEVPQDRKCTDVPFFTGFSICLLLLIPLSIIFSMGSDIRRFFYGYDRHGNICGIRNTPIFGINCSGQDMTLKPIAMMKYYPVNRCFRDSERKILPNTCVDSCDPPNELFFYRCYPPENVDLDDGSRYFKQMTEIFHVLSESTFTILAMTLAGLVLSFAMFFSLRFHHLIVTFWALVIFQLSASVMIAAVFWHKYVTSNNESILWLLVTFGAIIYFVFVLVYITIFRNTVMMTVRLYEEALAALFKMPMLFLHTLLILSAEIILIASLMFLFVLICSNGYLQQSEDPFTLEYNTSIYTLIFACYLIFMMLWIFAFFEGWQTMIVSSSVSLYQSARDKSALKQPIKESSKILIHYHLGTIAFGSFIVSLFSFLRGIVEYAIRKIYIQTALHGHTFSKSSFQVMKLLGSNLVPTIAVTGFNYVLTYGFAFLLMSLTVCMGLWVNSEQESMSRHYAHVGILFGAAITSIVVLFVIQLLNVATDTVFLRFCEEHVFSESVYFNPFFMNATIMKIIQRAKAFKKNHLNVY